MTSDLSSKNILFRFAKPSDIDAIMKIEHESFQKGVQESKETFLSKISVFSQGFMVAEDKETQEIGACIAGELWDISHPLTAETLAIGHDIAKVHTLTGQRLYIETFSSLSSWRGRKIGQALFQAFENKLRQDFPNLKEAVLILSEKWEVAKKIYEKNGFQEIERMSEFFTPENQPKETAILMKKVFK